MLRRPNSPLKPDAVSWGFSRFLSKRPEDLTGTNRHVYLLLPPSLGQVSAPNRPLCII